MKRAGDAIKDGCTQRRDAENLCPAEYSQDESSPGAEPPEDHYGRKSVMKMKEFESQLRELQRIRTRLRLKSEELD